MSSKNDKFYLKLALNLAKQHEGLTSENPSVGCVIVKNNKILSLSKTSINGRPHAEANAIRLANKNDLKGSTIYVTLEPCTHYGKTPPCTKNIINNGISEVYYSIDDVDVKVKGKSYSNSCSHASNGRNTPIQTLIPTFNLFVVFCLDPIIMHLDPLRQVRNIQLMMTISQRYFQGKFRILKSH